MIGSSVISSMIRISGRIISDAEVVECTKGDSGRAECAKGQWASCCTEYGSEGGKGSGNAATDPFCTHDSAVYGPEMMNCVELELTSRGPRIHISLCGERQCEVNRYKHCSCDTE